LARGIVSLEPIIGRLEGKRKLSQNRSDEDVAGTITNLTDSDRRGATAVRNAMIEADS
jgi:predicted FMN-binding regulatory protein PaiB